MANVTIYTKRLMNEPIQTQVSTFDSTEKKH